ncbi:kinase-like protein [Pseudovirgaria hyperparasitica]|uniref:Kinase-like protein n=1 Tax=Pseudovirgaria hyperparasitica TaxID=470096 RepID=A0A6A6VV06_9PEZI|nr:kinase-like protein [Pseudovirgaria hyperparasitica]KAF2754063.1 kinase-like protein [Pseudovirgaria hyperparasitica]
MLRYISCTASRLDRATSIICILLCCFTRKRSWKDLGQDSERFKTVSNHCEPDETNEHPSHEHPSEEQSSSEQYPNELKEISLNLNMLRYLAAGKASVVYSVDEARVYKEFHLRESEQIECQAYGLLAPHPTIAKLIQPWQDGIILERGTTLRELCQSGSNISLSTKLEWLIRAAAGYRHVHDCGIVHCDVGCNNLILTSEGVKLIDFEGCSLNGDSAGSCYEWFSYKPAQPQTSRATDIFAFGCIIYEIVVGKPPYSEYMYMEGAGQIVGQLYARGRFPETNNLPLSVLMQKCWRGEIESMDCIIETLEKEMQDISPQKKRVG